MILYNFFKKTLEKSYKICYNEIVEIDFNLTNKDFPADRGGHA